VAFYVGSAGILAGVFGLRAQVIGGALRSGELGIFELENPLASLPAPARMANAAVLLLRAVGRAVLPGNLSADESAWSLPRLPVHSPIALAALAACAALAAAALLRAGRRPALSFGALFFLLAALPTANLLFPTGTIFAERLMYLPSAGLCLCGGLAVAGARRRFAAGPARAATALFTAALCLMAMRTIVRNTAWVDDEALFLANVRTSPGSAKSHYNLGWVRGESGRFEEAREHYARAVQIYPKYWDAWSGKARAELELGRLEEAAASYAEAIRINPAHENAHFGAGTVRERRGDDAGAARAYRAGLVRRPDSLPLAFRLATVRSRMPGEDAGPDWKRALMLAPGSVASRIGYGRWLLARGRVAEAAVQAREAIRSSPRATDAWRLAAEIAASRGAGLAELLARERVFRLTREAGDLAALIAIARTRPDLAARFERLRPGLRRQAPQAFRQVEGESPANR
jgi:tetratricopeptide (TPR) repeat protein